MGGQLRNPSPKAVRSGVRRLSKLATQSGSPSAAERASSEGLAVIDVGVSAGDKPCQVFPGRLAKQLGATHTLPPSVRRKAVEKGAGDDAAEDVAGAFADSHKGSVTVEAFHLELGGIAVAAVDAHGIERRP